MATSAITAARSTIEEPTVDAHDDGEQVMGLELPFTTKVPGVDVKVDRIELRSDKSIVAICTRGRDRQTVPLLDLSLPKPPPAGWEWIAAYRTFCRGTRS